MTSSKGLRTWLPSDVKKQIFVKDKLVNLYSNWAYDPIVVPTLVGTDVVESANNKFKAKTFKFVDKDGEMLALRTEITQPIAKAIANRKQDLEFPLRLYYCSSVFRYSGLAATDDSREIEQAGIELIGLKQSQACSDYEALSLFIESAEQFGLKDFIVTVTHTDIWQKIFELYAKDNLAESAYQFLSRGDILGFKKSIGKKHPLNCLLETDSVAAIEKALGIKLSYFKKFITEMQSIYPNIVFEPSKCPDLRLYTGIHFNLLVRGHGKFIAMGGRYDELYKSFGADLPAIGFAYYLPRFLDVINSQGLLPQKLNDGTKTMIKTDKDWRSILSNIKTQTGKGKRIQIQ
jgi:ATP phosphoribosyltransferase regulatory subunit